MGSCDGRVVECLTGAMLASRRCDDRSPLTSRLRGVSRRGSPVREGHQRLPRSQRDRQDARHEGPVRDGAGGGGREVAEQPGREAAREARARVPPRHLSIGRLGHRRKGQRGARVVLSSGRKVIDHSIYSKTSAVTKVTQTWSKVPTAVFLPSRETLAMYEGFIATYQARELSFDETYFDLAVALGGGALRGTKPAAIDAILRRMERVLSGSVVLAGPRVYLRGEGGTMLEAHLVSSPKACGRSRGGGRREGTRHARWDDVGLSSWCRRAWSRASRGRADGRDSARAPLARGG